MEPKNVPLDYRHLKTFCRVAELKSFSKAADELCITQPTVSGHVLSLEHSLGFRLLDRTGREACLTKGGKILYQHASQMLAHRKDALNALSEFSQGIRGELSLGASTIPGEYLLPKLLGDFKKEYPHLSISLKIGDTKAVVQDMLLGKIEFGMTGARVNHASLHYDLFEEDEIIVIGPSSHRGLQKQRMSYKEMITLPWVVREEGSGTQMAVERALKKRNGSLSQFNRTIEMGSTSSLKEAVKAGLGFAFISRRAVEQELSQGLLVRLEVDDLDPIVRQIYIVLYQGRSLSPIGLKFLRYLKRKKEGLT